MANIPIWPGSSSFALSANPTPFGFYDQDPEFRKDIDNVASWTATRLGYPLIDIELQDINFYTCFEEAINEYGAQVYNFQIINNFYTLKGKVTGSNLNNIDVKTEIMDVGDDYGGSAGGGTSTVAAGQRLHSGSLEVKEGQQRYDLKTAAGSSISGSNVKIKKIYHYAPAALNRYFDPYAGTGTGIQSLMQAFGFGNYSPGVNFMLMPLYFDVLKLQAIEFNDQIRKSAYHFEINNNRYLKLWPIPKQNYTLWFDYTVSELSDNLTSGSAGDESEPTPVDRITDISNAPYTNPTYKFINDPGRQWIRKYTLALAKEMLGGIRGKYQTIPIPGSDTTLDYSRLLSEAADEKRDLVDTLRADLLELSRVKQLERQNEEADYAQSNYDKIPFQIFVG